MTKAERRAYGKARYARLRKLGRCTVGGCFKKTAKSRCASCMKQAAAQHCKTCRCRDGKAA